MVLLLAGVLHQQGRPKVDGLIRLALDRLGLEPTLADQARSAGLLGAVLRDLEPLDYEAADARYLKLLDEALGIFDAARSRAIANQGLASKPPKPSASRETEASSPAIPSATSASRRGVS